MKLPTFRQTSLAIGQLILLAALVLPAMVPTGYMVKRNTETNLVELTVCSGVNHRQILLDLDTGSFHEVDPKAGPTDTTTIVIIESESCPFAISGVAMPSICEVQALQIGPSVFETGQVPGQIVRSWRTLPPVRAPPLVS